MIIGYSSMACYRAFDSRAVSISLVDRPLDLPSYVPPYPALNYQIDISISIQCYAVLFGKFLCVSKTGEPEPRSSAAWLGDASWAIKGKSRTPLEV